MTVVINDEALNRFLRSTFGPVGIDLAKRAESVYEHARLNASGAIIGIRSTDLLSNLFARVESTKDGLQARVGTTAQHRAFFYPTFHDQNGRPWLTTALRDGFRDNA